MADSELRIAVDPASPRGDYTAKAEYRVLADGRIRIERVWIEPRTEQSSHGGSEHMEGSGE